VNVGHPIVTNEDFVV